VSRAFLFAVLTSSTSPALAADVVWQDASSDLGEVRIVSVPQGGSGYSGVAALDYDLDGDLDLYFGNGPNRDNVLLSNDGTGVFRDVTLDARAEVGTGTRGVLAADLDNDGYPDLVLPGDRSRQNVLMNNGDGTFTNVTETSQLWGAFRTSSAHAADVNGNGLLDVYVAAAVLPQESMANSLYLNNGDRTFTEVGTAAGVDTDRGACSATFTHFDDDAAIDLVVANCAEITEGVGLLPFEMYRNRGDGTFEDIYEQSQVWGLGHWMGLAVADFDGDGAQDFFATNGGLDRDQPNGLYRNNGDGTWSDVAAEVGVKDFEFGWGAVATDVDNDGWLDLYYVGKSQARDNCSSPGNLFMNEGDGNFAPPLIPIDLKEVWTTGLVHGDFDGNGFEDLVIVATENIGGHGIPIFLRNLGNDNHWLTVRLVGTTSNSAGIGSRIRATAGGRDQLREVQAGSSYLSTNTPWPSFGLGSETSAEICVRWPDGKGENFGAFEADQLVELVQGEGLGAGDCSISVSNAGGRDGKETEDGKCGCEAGGSPTWLWLLIGLVAVRRSRWSVLGLTAIACGSSPEKPGSGPTPDDTAVVVAPLASVADAEAKITGEAGGDWLARQVAPAGDVNQDGFADIVTGGLWNTEGGLDAGAGYLLLGPVSGTLSAADADAKFVGESEGDAAGVSVYGAGDVNADGFDDLLIAADAHDFPFENAGAVYLMSGPVTGTHDLSTADAKMVGESRGDLAGISVSGIGDHNGDGFDDVLIGARLQNQAGPDAGAAYVVLGPMSGLLSLEDASTKLLGEAPGDQLGIIVAAGGDVNGDGFDDLLVGARYNDLGGEDGGAGYLLYGPTSGLVSMVAADAKVFAEAAFDRASRVARGGDLNGDGNDDVLLGARYHDAAAPGAGAIYVMHGPIVGNINASEADAKILGEATGDGMGLRLASAGDVNGDGHEDIVAGAVFERTAGIEAGAGYIVLGPLAGIQDLSEVGHKLVAENPHDWLGSSAAGVGDVNGDGFDDYMFGATMEDSAGPDAGAAYLILGGDL